MRILLASDGSPGAMQAAEWVVASGLPTGASVLILGVVTSAAAPVLPTAVADGPRKAARTAAEQTRAALEPGATSAEVRIEEGDAGDEIMRVADEWDADLVVVGSRGLGRAEGFVLGTVSLAVVRHCARPVLVVKGHTRMLRSAIVALDGSEQALDAVRFFARWPRPAELTTHVVGVVETPPFPRTAPAMIRAELQAAVAVAEAERRDALEQAFEAARPLLAGGLTAETLLSGDPARELLQIAEKEAADLIVLGARGLGAVQRLLLGSVSEAVLRDAQCAVLVAARPSRSRARDCPPRSRSRD